jgi:hypothetical protein
MSYREVNKALKVRFEEILSPLGFKAKFALQGCEFKIYNYC